MEIFIPRHDTENENSGLLFEYFQTYLDQTEHQHKYFPVGVTFQCKITADL